MREEQLEAFRWLQTRLKDYIHFKLRNVTRTARLGFSSEKELLNICAKLFSSEVKQMPTQRRLISLFWIAV